MTWMHSWKSTLGDVYHREHPNGDFVAWCNPGISLVQSSARTVPDGYVCARCRALSSRLPLDQQHLPPSDINHAQIIDG